MPDSPCQHSATVVSTASLVGIGGPASNHCQAAEWLAPITPNADLVLGLLETLLDPPA